MAHKSLSTSKPSLPNIFTISFFFFFFFFTISITKTSSHDPQSEACGPKSCGNVSEIRCPFWLSSKQQPDCGYRDFKVTCEDGRSPVLNISGDSYILKDIFYANQSFRVAYLGAFEDECPTPLHNLTLKATHFSISPSSTVSFSIVYNCTKKPPDNRTVPLSCASNATRFSFASCDKGLLEGQNDFSLGSCEELVDVAIDSHEAYPTAFSDKKYAEILRTGFVLNWRVPSCLSCKKSGGDCALDDNEKLDCFCRNEPEPNSYENVIDMPRKIIIGVVAAAVGVIAASGACYWYQRRKKRISAASSTLLSRNISSDPSSTAADIEKGGGLAGVHLFTYEELEEATNCFDPSKELGDGGFGTVYYGKLRDGREVAVKRLYENNCKRLEQFLNEVEILTRLQHSNLVTLYGCTSRHSRELLLVYEYVSNGTLADHLHGERAKPGSLPWHTRLKITVETASALKYLHASGIIHRDVKTNNILLDDHFKVKVADFGLSRLFPTNRTHVSTAPQGTPGYVDPEYHQCYQLTNKSDVFSFGVVLVELISSMPAVDITRHRHEINLSNMAINKIQNDMLHEMVDPTLGFDTNPMVRASVAAVAELAFQCLQGDKDLRPTMAEVLDRLMRLQDDHKYFTGQVEDVDVNGEDVALMKKNCPLVAQSSPNSVMAKWSCSNDTTPNTSN